ncbi:SCO1431 family membrane protein [Streptomyces sp. NPDC101194]|uniref:SCO1431 family membrane protein n=1 Tax=Streptomyces sp. NPDC101194 TaxID=3366127 RepID=UPI00380FF1CF
MRGAEKKPPYAQVDDDLAAVDRHVRHRPTVGPVHLTVGVPATGPGAGSGLRRRPPARGRAAGAVADASTPGPCFRHCGRVVEGHPLPAERDAITAHAAGTATAPVTRRRARTGGPWDGPKLLETVPGWILVVVIAEFVTRAGLM